MYGLLEVDATEARQVIAEHKARTGETLSFTGFLVFCMGRAVDQDKSVQAYLKDGKTLRHLRRSQRVVDGRTEGRRQGRLDGACDPGGQPEDVPGDP